MSITDQHMTTEEIADALGVSRPPDRKPSIADQLAAIEGLQFSDCIGFFNSRATDRERKIADMVDTDEGEFEADDAIVSEGEDNGAYVLGWRWVSFEGTPFTKCCSECDYQGGLTKVEMRDGTTSFLCEPCVSDITCPNCGAIEGTEEWGTVGDGFDGYCPSCADKREASGEVEVG